MKAAALLKLVAATAVLGASKMVFGNSTRPAELPRPQVGNPAGDDGHSKREDLITYSVGYALALLLTAAAFALVHWRWTSTATALGLVYALALTQAVVHLRCFLHVDLKRAARDDLQLILFSTVIIMLMVGGTLVVLLNLRMRMM